MNRKVCEHCHRYGGPGPNNGWYCARYAILMDSDVIPGHAYWNKDMFHLIVKASVMPDWCEFPLEQAILEPEDDADMRPDKRIVYNGNDQAEIHRKTRG